MNRSKGRYYPDHQDNQKFVSDNLLPQRAFKLKSPPFRNRDFKKQKNEIYTIK